MGFIDRLLFNGLSGCASSTRVSYGCARIVFNNRLKNYHKSGGGGELIEVFIKRQLAWPAKLIVV